MPGKKYKVIDGKLVEVGTTETPRQDNSFNVTHVGPSVDELRRQAEEDKVRKNLAYDPTSGDDHD